MTSGAGAVLSGVRDVQFVGETVVLRLPIVLGRQFSLSVPATNEGQCAASLAPPIVVPAAKVLAISSASRVWHSRAMLDENGKVPDANFSVDPDDEAIATVSNGGSILSQ